MRNPTHALLSAALAATIWAVPGLVCTAQQPAPSRLPAPAPGGGPSSDPFLLRSMAEPEAKNPAIDDADGAVGWLLVAMAAVESGHDSSAVGDGGHAIGTYQIHRAYWKDSGVPGTWANCRDTDYARRVILAYWKRYCPEALNTGNAEVLCRVHNGGPDGHRKRSTAAYWRKIQEALVAMKDGNPGSRNRAPAFDPGKTDREIGSVRGEARPLQETTVRLAARNRAVVMPGATSLADVFSSSASSTENRPGSRDNTLMAPKALPSVLRGRAGEDA